MDLNISQQDIFVGRQSIISESAEFLSGLSHEFSEDMPRLLFIEGPGGIGKTKFLMRLREELFNGLRCEITDVIDLKATANRSPISLLQSIAESLRQPVGKSSNSDDSFSEFFQAIDKYNASRAQEKHKLYSFVIDAFINCFKLRSEVSPQIVILDTYETVQTLELGHWLLESFLPRLNGRIGFVLAGRDRISPQNIRFLSLLLERLSEDEINGLGKKLFEYRGVAEDYDLSLEVVKKIAHLTNGRPILVVLTFEWILECVDVESIISIPKPEFEKRIVEYLKDLKNDHNNVVIIMATVERRLTSKMLALLTNWDIRKCRDIGREISRFSFIKVIERDDVEEIIYTLHDEMYRLINTHLGHSEAVKNKWRRQIVSEFYENAISEASDPQIKQTMKAEKLFYQLFYSPEEAIQSFDDEMSLAIERYEFDFCTLLLSEVNRAEISLNKRHRNIIKLNNAEMLVKSYKPLDAKPIFDDLIMSFDPEIDAAYVSRVISGIGACIANGSTVIEANIHEAISMLKRSLEICREKRLDDRITSILYEIGYCYDLLGYNQQTLDYFAESNKLARQLNHYKLITNTLDEMGKLRLKRYEVEQALQLFQESLAIKQQTNDVSGMAASYHLLGNAYRDLDHFPDALKWYELAETARLAVMDDWGLCQLYSDVAWLYLLSKDWIKTNEYLDKEYSLAVQRNFGREIADAEHSYYHLKFETEGLDAAMPWIEESFRHAHIYSNIFIYLDAASHLIEAAYERGQYDKIPFYYQKMEELEEKGCGYRIFKGRTINILGDVDYNQGKYQEAVDKWQNGYTIVGIHGRSRSATTTFDDHLSGRQIRLSDALRKCGIDRIKAFQEHWGQQILDDGKLDTLADEYPAMMGILYCSIGDSYYDSEKYEEALRFWIVGFREVARHITWKARSSSLNFNIQFECRREQLQYATGRVASDCIEFVKNELVNLSFPESSSEAIKTFNDLINPLYELFV